MAKKGRLTNEETQQKKELAKLIFLTEDITIKELAERVISTEKTISKWIQEEQWGKLKRNIPLTRDELLASWYDELAELKEHIKKKPEGQRFADYKEAQLRRQLLKDIDTLQQDSGIPDVISVITDFVKFIRRNMPDKTQEIAQYADGYVKHKLRS